MDEPIEGIADEVGNSPEDRHQESYDGDTTDDLVGRLAGAGEWPDPSLLEAIFARGGEAVAPLLRVVAETPYGWPAQAPLDSALGILGALRAREAIPAVAEVIRRADNDVLDLAADVLVVLGPEALDTVLDLVQEPSISWDNRATAARAAVEIAADDLPRRARVAEVFRGILADLVSRPEKLDEDGFMSASFMVMELARLADPLAPDIIEAAFKAKRVDTDLINRAGVKSYYSKGGEPRRAEPVDFLADYREAYEDEIRWRKSHSEEIAREEEIAWKAAMPLDRPEEDWPRIVDPSPPPLRLEPIRRAESRPGRNDPCWCGSGKKYKKCHMAQDEG